MHAGVTRTLYLSMFGDFCFSLKYCEIDQFPSHLIALQLDGLCVIGNTLEVELFFVFKK